MLGGPKNEMCFARKVDEEDFTEFSLSHDCIGEGHSVCLYEGVGFIFTGGKGTEKQCHLYRVTEQNWEKLPDLTRGRYSHGSVCIDGVVYALGGVYQSSKLKDVECLNIQNDKQWAALPSFPTELDNVKTVTVNTQCIYSGGVEMINSGYRCNREDLAMWSYDIVKQTHEKKATLITSIGSNISFSIVHTQNRIFLYEGTQQNFLVHFVPLNSWCTLTPPKTKHFTGALAVYDRRVMLLGGEGEEDVTEEYNTDTITWSLSHFQLPKFTSNVSMFAVKPFTT